MERITEEKENPKLWMSRQTNRTQTFPAMVYPTLAKSSRQEGAALRDAAQKIARIYEDLDKTLQKNRQPGLIRLGCMRVQADELLQALPFQAFRSRFPHVQIEIMEEHTPILAQKLRDGQLDFYLGIRDFCTAETEYHFFREIPAILPPDHSRMRRTADQYARDQGYELQVTFEMMRKA